jgi:hypothetical protein
MAKVRESFTDSHDVHGSFTGFEAGSAQDKLDKLLADVGADPGTTAPWPTLFQLINLLIESMNPTVSAKTDTMPIGRKKLIHTVGAVAAVKFEFEQNAYTGLFQGAPYALARFSSAKEPNPKSTSFVGGSGFKLFRDNVTSGNFVAMNSLQASESWNIFNAKFSNHISIKQVPFTLKPVLCKFQTVSEWPTHVGLSDLAKFDQYGREIPQEQVQFPNQLLLIPTRAAKRLFPDTYVKPLEDQLLNVRVNTVLYNIYASPAPKAEFVKIGKITTTSSFYKSETGDNLFMKHQKFEDDLEYYPEWLDVCPDVHACPACPADVECQIKRSALWKIVGAL